MTAVTSEILVRTDDLDYTEDIARLYDCSVVYIIENSWHDGTTYVQVEGAPEDIESFNAHVLCA